MQIIFEVRKLILVSNNIKILNEPTPQSANSHNQISKKWLNTKESYIYVKEANKNKDNLINLMNFKRLTRGNKIP